MALARKLVAQDSTAPPPTLAVKKIHHCGAQSGGTQALQRSTDGILLQKAG
jgi:hypothetical protein